MAGLVGYDSSDDEGDAGTPARREAEPALSGAAHDRVVAGSEAAKQRPDAERTEPPVDAAVIQSAVPLGPSLPPSMEDAREASDWYRPEGSASPYSANRALIHDLTLPSVPNLDIPPSPPGSPPPQTAKSFETFLQLKERGVHFNAKLEQSAALRNPGVLEKLLDFVGLDERQLYETTLPPDLWDPAAFPEDSFLDRLKKSRDKIAKQREAHKNKGARSSVDFVPSTAASNGNAPPAGGLSRGDKGRSGWR